MTDIEINKTIHEAMGLKWHKLWYGIDSSYGESYLSGCKTCNIDFMSEEAIERREGSDKHRNPSYTTNWSDYGTALEWLMSDKKLFGEFLFFTEGTDFHYVSTELLVIENGSRIIAEFLNERKESRG